MMTSFYVSRIFVDVMLGECLNYAAWFHVEVRPQVSIQRWIVTPSHDSTLNYHLVLWSQFNVEIWPRVIIQRGIPTQGHNSTWNFDPGLQFNVEFWPVYISSTRGIATQEGVKIQQRDQNSTAKEGHNSTKNPLNIDPGSVFNWGVKILSYTGIAFLILCNSDIQFLLSRSCL